MGLAAPCEVLERVGAISLVRHALNRHVKHAFWDPAVRGSTGTLLITTLGFLALLLFFCLCSSRHKVDEGEHQWRQIRLYSLTWHLARHGAPGRSTRGRVIPPPDLITDKNLRKLS